MKEQERLRINVNKLIPGMEVAEDIYTPKGLMIIPKNTVLDDKHIFRIKLYQIMSILIFNAGEGDDYQADMSPQFVSEVTQNFSDFKDRYVVYHKQTEDSLNDIVDGKTIDEDDLFEVSHVLVDSIRTQSELFNYLYYLKEDDDYTYTHCLNVSILANIFAKWLHLSDDEAKEVTIAGLLHDIGKIQIDNGILNKPGKLTDDEFTLIKQHSTLGYNIIKDQDINDQIKQAVLLHHEKLDGSGYPLGIKDKQIPLYAKIITICDIYDAMTAKRSYHEKQSPFKVIKMFEEESYGLLDTKLLFVFLENIAHNYLGKDVLLSTGQQARIVFIHNQSPSRPIVQINEAMVDLMDKPGVYITELL